MQEITREQKYRVIEECDELTKKADRLYAFIESPDFQNIDDEDQSLLIDQYDAMYEYIYILRQRIERFGGTE